MRGPAGKWQRIQDICNSLGVRWQPACIEGIWIVPILSWYHASWDREPDLPNTLPIHKVSAHSSSQIVDEGLEQGMNEKTVVQQLASTAAAAAAVFTLVDEHWRGFA